MTISLGGGSDGPANGGMTSIGGRPGPGADAARRAAEAPKPVRPPAAKTPEMTVPMPNAQAASRRRRRRRCKQAPDEARGRTPTQRRRDARQAARSPRPARAARASGCRPAAAPAPASTLDVADFCCPDYLVHDDRAHPHATGISSADVAGDVVVKFTIQRDGTHHRRRRSSSRAATRRSTSARSARVVGHATAAAAAGAVPQPDADRSPQFRIHNDDAESIRAMSRRRRRAAARRRGARRAAAAAGASSRRRRSSRARSRTTISGDGRRAAAARRARLHRAVERRRDGRRSPRRSRRCCGTT